MPPQLQAIVRERGGEQEHFSNVQINLGPHDIRAVAGDEPSDTTEE